MKSKPFAHGLRAAAIACAREVRASGARVFAVLGVGALACAACCAAPLLLSAVGVSAAALGAASVAGVFEPYVLVMTAALGGAVVLAGAIRWQRAAHGGICPIDGSCGCRAATVERVDG